MDSNKIFDVVVIGGGIVGLATAMALLLRKKLSIAVLEAEDKIAAHQTGNNSGVIHSGLYYKPGSLKARNCVEGRKLLYEFCRENDVKYEQCGKLVVAATAVEISALNELEERGKANGLTGLKRLKKEELKDYEPYVKGIAGLFVGETGIVDYNDVAEAFANKVKQDGGEIFLKSRFIGLNKEGGGLLLKTTSRELKSKMLINCGGLQSDRIASLCGVVPGLQIIPFRGEYYKLKKDKEHLVKNLIYPVPDPRFPFLGVHFTRMIKGGVEAGPNAVLAFKREGYTHKDFSFSDFMQMFTFPGFWKMAAKYYKTGIGEFYRSLSKAAFVHALQKLIPEIMASDIEPGGAGVRAQALEPDGNLVDDFRIVETERMVHVLNAPSPAATASISIGRKIADIMLKRLN